MELQYSVIKLKTKQNTILLSTCNVPGSKLCALHAQFNLKSQTTRSYISFMDKEIEAKKKLVTAYVIE